MQIDKVAEENAVVGEGPIWNADQQALIWTDIHTGRLFSFDPGTGESAIHSGFNVGAHAKCVRGLRLFHMGRRSAVELGRRLGARAAGIV